MGILAPTLVKRSGRLKLDNLHEVVLGLVHARDVVEGDAGVGLHLEPA